MKITGRVIAQHFRGDRLLRTISGSNLVVDSGRTLIKDIVTPPGATKPSHFAVGSDGDAVEADQTALGSEHATITRGALAFLDTPFTILYYGTITNDSGGTVTVREFGLFNAAAAGTMLARFLSQEFDFENGDQVYMGWIITFGEDS